MAFLCKSLRPELISITPIITEIPLAAIKIRLECKSKASKSVNSFLVFGDYSLQASTAHATTKFNVTQANIVQPILFFLLVIISLNTAIFLDPLYK
jgi:hypothetical protein